MLGQLAIMCHCKLYGNQFQMLLWELRLCQDTLTEVGNS